MESAIVDYTDAGISKPELRPSAGAMLSSDFSTFRCDKTKIDLIEGLKIGDSELSEEVWIESLNGFDEQRADNVGIELSLPQWITEILGTKVRINGKPIGNEYAAKMSVADRDMLIINLRMMTFGPEIWGTTICPLNSCGLKLDFMFDLTSLEIPSSGNKDEIHKETFIHNEKPITFRYRKPNGSDQEEIYELMFTDRYQALLTLLSRCVVDIDNIPNRSEDILSRLSPKELSLIEKVISENMPSFDWDLKLLCPECKRDIISTIDIQSYFWKEIQLTKDDFWNEIHQIAFNYHWSEKDILNLPRWKRKMYLNYIGNTGTR